MTTPRSVIWCCGLTWLFALCFLASCTGVADTKLDASFIHIPGEKGAKSAPKMRWSPAHIDLGLVAAGETRELTYALTNVGEAPMVMAQVLPSCGCTVVQDWDSTPLQPGKSMDLTLQFAAGDATRSVEEYATVVTNAIPASVQLTFNAQVLGPETLSTP